MESADPTGGVGLTRDTFLPYARLRLGMPDRDLYALEASFTRLVDLTDTVNHFSLTRAGFDITHFYAESSESYGDCPRLAQQGVALGWEAVLAPSAAWRPRGKCLAVLPAGLSRISRASLIMGRARPTVAVAVVTTYPASGRPAWLPPWLS